MKNKPDVFIKREYIALNFLHTSTQPRTIKQNLPPTQLYSVYFKKKMKVTY